MNTTINAVKFKADPKLEKFVNEKVAKLDRLIDNATKCEVILKIDKPETRRRQYRVTADEPYGLVLVSVYPEALVKGEVYVALHHVAVSRIGIDDCGA